MTRRFLLPALLAAASFAHAAKPDDLDRQRLIAHFEMTDSWLADEVAHLTPAQMHFRPTPTSWNIIDCVEHLTLAEPEYWRAYQAAMKAKATKEESPSDDIDRMWYGIDRTERGKTVPSETPKARFDDTAPALDEFLKLRATMLEYIRTTQEDWRHHMIPDWNRDGFQWRLMISAHSQRHILQIREIKHSPGYPK
ncbi:MAG: DinB family protein [Acidobacteriota bacterium]|nr:DinB family protein [Acidobacteriota bacterium]